MMEQERITETIAEEGSRLRNFIRKWVRNEADVEDLLQEVFAELIEARKLLMPIDYVTGWLFQVARNRVIDSFRKQRPESFRAAAVESEDGELLLPSPDAGPEAALLRSRLLEELKSALALLPEEQRAVFVGHALEGRSFREMAEESGLSVNTLLARKRYAVLALRRRLQRVHDEWIRK
jgi:RNA polymerase sigma factor (sigma-70 family)